MFDKIKKWQKKKIAIILIFILAFSFTNVTQKNEVKATSNRYTYNGSNLDTKKYPGFKEKIDALKQAHKNWNFVIMETGLDWNQTIIAESAFSASSPISLIQDKSGDWICTSCGSKTYDNGSWYHASEDAIKYYMDARNWLNDNAYILQFLQVGYVEATDQNIYNALNGTFLYTMDNAKVINSVCKAKGANPYYIIARIIQEQGTNGSATSKMVSDGVTYYNLFNIGASGNGNRTIVSGALAKAKEKGWTSIQKSLEGGIEILFSDYIQNKQDTMYLNKFDVESYGGIYSHQYMQNIQAPTSEAMTMYNKVKESGILNQSLTFVIPVFTNMPSTVSPSPDTIGELGVKNIRIKQGHSDINVRSSRTTSGNNKIGTIKDSNTVVLSVERYGDGWHKVVYEDNGTFKTGYIFFDTNYFEEINDITNCNEQIMVTGDGVKLRTGPGTTQREITTLSKGQTVTRIDNSGKYKIDGVIWDRVKLSDGRQGFIVRDYLGNLDSAEIYQVRADGGLFLRTEPNGYNIRILPDGTEVTVVEKGTKEINGYIWYKVVTPSGATGYVASSYLRIVKQNVKAENSKKDDSKKQVIMEPDVTIKNIRDKQYGSKVEILDKNNKAITDDSQLIGTGYTIKIDGVEYKAVKLADMNGDGTIDSADLLKITKHLMKVKMIDNEPYIKAADINGDGTIDSSDLLKITKYLMNVSAINLN